jgi:hypothetical protein
MAIALENGQFSTWKSENLESNITLYQKSTEKLIGKINNELQKNISERLDICVPNQPNVSLPTRQERTFRQKFGDIFNGGANGKKLDVEYEKQKWQAHKNAANDYLATFSKNMLESVNRYENEVRPSIRYTIPPEPWQLIEQRNLSKSLRAAILEADNLKLLSINNNHRFKRIKKIFANMTYCKYWFLSILTIV